MNLKSDNHKLALVAGYILTAGLFFGLGQFMYHARPPEIKIEEPAIDLSNLNLTANPAPAQQVAGAAANKNDLDCAGKIKGSSSRIYHMPGGSFYDRLSPVICFATEAEAVTAGFRKSQR